MPNTPPRRSRKVLLGFAALVVLAAVAFFWLSPAKKTEYLTATVQRTDLENAVLATGVLQALRQVEVGAQVSGQLKSLKVVLGQTVKKGDWLAEIDPVISQNTLAQEQAKLENLQAQKLAKEVRIKQAELTWARQREMLAQDAAPRQDMESADAELRALRADGVSLEAQIRQQKLAMASAQTNLSYTRIVAPIDGDVVSISTLEGQTVVAAFQVPTLMKLADLSTMTVKAQVSEADVVRVKAGLPVYFTILGDPDKRYHGTLRAVQPSPEKINNAVFFNALFDVPNPDRTLRVDMTAQVTILLGEAKQALTVPLTALGARDKDGRQEVRVLKPDHTVEKRQVRVGISNNFQAQVLEGLKEGDTVITGDASAVLERGEGGDGGGNRGKRQ
ncbi:macrolide transporter subunit MacA [Variovorax boronicumulans]|uniref:macrolide transporter subunit MacA n=1 Tax=Variovorax boronicumulans TaxID=436515 RepID=UPI00277F172F|nr:macrolide transporter subunit MacA [Variovorax boronicumulans]MDQ0041156.1 macrolide-specific efflux system membrane fusion protein [Variovorax boronicumulans]